MPFNAQPRANMTAINKALEDLISNPTPSPVNTYTKTQIDDFLDNKVDKVTGKQLSTNDFTDYYKNKIDNAATNTLKFKGFKVSTSFLPQVGNEVGDIYIVGTPLDGSDKAEYLWTGLEWEKFGIVNIDLSDYIKEADVPGILGDYNINTDTINIINQQLVNKVNVDGNKSLTTNDFTDYYKNKLEGLSNYNDTDIRNLINDSNNAVIGENLLKCPYAWVSGFDGYNTGVTPTYNTDDGVLYLNGSRTSNKTILFRLINSTSPVRNIVNLEADMYTLTVETSDYSNLRIAYFLAKTYDDQSHGLGFDLQNNKTIIKIDNRSGEYKYINFLSIVCTSSAVVDYDNVSVKVMLEKGDISHEYQPYKLSRQSFREDLDTLLNA